MRLIFVIPQRLVLTLPWCIFCVSTFLGFYLFCFTWYFLFYPNCSFWMVLSYSSMLTVLLICIPFGLLMHFLLLISTFLMTVCRIFCVQFIPYHQSLCGALFSDSGSLNLSAIVLFGFGNNLPNPLKKSSNFNCMKFHYRIQELIVPSPDAPL